MWGLSQLPGVHPVVHMWGLGKWLSCGCLGPLELGMDGGPPIYLCSKSQEWCCLHSEHHFRLRLHPTICFSPNAWMCKPMAQGPLRKDPWQALPTCGRHPSHCKAHLFPSMDSESEFIWVPETGREMVPFMVTDLRLLIICSCFL